MKTEQASTQQFES